MRVLLTGAWGFVGLNLALDLAARPNVELFAADLNPPGSPTAIRLAAQPGVTPLVLDVTDRAAVANVIYLHRLTHIVHAAALTPSQEVEVNYPTRIVDVNLQGAIHVLDAAYASPSVSRLLLVSSSGVYGAPGPHAGPAQAEAGPLNLEGLYAITKYSAELIGARYAALAASRGGTLITSVRLGPIYGPYEAVSATRPQISQPGRLLEALHANRRVTVAGPDTLRDWTHVDDVAGGIWALLQAPRWNYPVYNLSLGRGIPFRTVVDAFMARGLHATWIDDPAAADIALAPSQARLPLDITRLQSDTGFTPQIDFAHGVARLLATS
jgi:nucleoside-diphosphate-sugar epimerase